MTLLRIQPRIHRDEGRGKHALAEKILQKIGNAKRGAKCVCGIGVAEVVRKDAIAHKPDQSAEEDADGDEKRMRLCGCAAGWSGQNIIIGTKSSFQAMAPSGVLSHISKSRSPPHGPGPVRGGPRLWGTQCLCCAGGGGDDCPLFAETVLLRRDGDAV